MGGGPSSNKLETPKSVHTLPAIQDGGFACLLNKGDYICKLDLKDAYFSVPLHPASRKFVRFLWSGKLYEFFIFVLD